ncbi:hypothetical protein KPB2_5358 [Klebsiella pneumoniae Kb677]|nr:hypothetical protein KPB2_5358 [Klebsiella pneumoniae Kb677]
MALMAGLNETTAEICSTGGSINLSRLRGKPLVRGHSQFFSLGEQAAARDGPLSRVYVPVRKDVDENEAASTLVWQVTPQNHLVLRASASIVGQVVSYGGRRRDANFSVGALRQRPFGCSRPQTLVQGPPQVVAEGRIDLPITKADQVTIGVRVLATVMRSRVTHRSVNSEARLVGVSANLAEETVFGVVVLETSPNTVDLH